MNGLGYVLNSLYSSHAPKDVHQPATRSGSSAAGSIFVTCIQRIISGAVSKYPSSIMMYCLYRSLCGNICSTIQGPSVLTSTDVSKPQICLRYSGSSPRNLTCLMVAQAHCLNRPHSLFSGPPYYHHEVFFQQLIVHLRRIPFDIFQVKCYPMNRPPLRFSPQAFPSLLPHIQSLLLLSSTPPLLSSVPSRPTHPILNLFCTRSLPFFRPAPVSTSSPYSHSFYCMFTEPLTFRITTRPSRL